MKDSIIKSLLYITLGLLPFTSIYAMILCSSILKKIRLPYGIEIIVMLGLIVLIMWLADKVLINLIKHIKDEDI